MYRITKVILLDMEKTLQENNAWPVYILLLYPDQLKESVFGNLLILKS